MAFDGTGDYLTIPDHNDFKFDGDYTIECWFYTGSSSGGCFFSKHQAGVANIGLFINRTTAGKIRWQDDKNSIYTEVGSSLNNSAWHHLALVRSGSASSNLKLYIDGTLASTQSGSTAQTQTSDVAIGYYINNNDKYLDGYIDEYRISNVARYTGNFTPSTSAFTEDANTVLLIHSDTTNGSTTFTDSSGATGGLGNDASANSNHFTPTNLASSDQVTDTPTNNWCTFNSIEDNIHHVGHFGEGNLEGAGKTSSYFHMGSVGTMHTTNKIYYEVYLSNQSNPDFFIGIAPDDYSPTTSPSGDAVTNFPGKNFHGACLYTSVNTVYYDGSSTASLTASGATGNILSCAFDPATGKIWFANNGTWYGSGNPSTGANPAVTLSNLTRSGGASHSWKPCVGQYQLASRMILNCGQDGTFAGNKTAQGNADDNGYGNFYYDVPTGFLALCSQNLPEPTVTPSEHFSATIRTGDNSQAVTGIGFQPDLVWSKTRNQTHSHQIHDSVRGATDGMLNPDTNSARSTTYQLDSFDSDGFTIDSGNLVGMNGSGNTYVTWAWKANGSGSSNTDGSITSTVSANTSAGFSIVEHSGTSSNGTVGHGLSKAPELVITKAYSDADQWRVGSVQSLGSMDFTDYLKLNDTNAITDEATTWNDTAPTSSVFSVGTDSATNYSGYDHISYCFHSVEGYSKIGSYLANYNADGTFFYTGFRPAFVMTKRMDSTGWWVLFDTARSTSNPCDHLLAANVNNAENGPGSDTMLADILSNGFKLREADSYSNASGGKFLYVAFAEQPFKYSNAR